MQLGNRMKHTTQAIIYSSILLLLASQTFFKSELWRHVVIGVAGGIFVAMIGMMFLKPKCDVN